MVGLYLDPPEPALVLCVDGEVAGPGAGPVPPVLPMMPGMPERRTHDYLRNGVTSLFAALDIATGQVIGSLHCHFRSIEFKKFLARAGQGSPDRPRRPSGLRQLRHPQDRHHPAVAGLPTRDFTCILSRPARPG